MLSWYSVRNAYQKEVFISCLKRDFLSSACAAICGTIVSPSARLLLEQLPVAWCGFWVVQSERLTCPLVLLGTLRSLSPTPARISL